MMCVPDNWMPRLLRGMTRERSRTREMTAAFAGLRKERHPEPMRILLAAATLLSLGAPALAQSAIPVLPKEMLGTWGFEDMESCNTGSDTQMAASARSVEFYASSYALKKIWRQANGAVKATATTSEEGEARKRHGAIALKLVSPDKLSVTTGRDEPMTYVRCKPPGKAG